MGKKFEHVLGFSQGGFLIELLLGLRGEKNVLSESEKDCDSDSYNGEVDEADASTCAPDTPRDVEGAEEDAIANDASSVLRQIYKNAIVLARGEDSAAADA